MELLRYMMSRLSAASLPVDIAALLLAGFSIGGGGLDPTLRDDGRDDVLGGTRSCFARRNFSEGGECAGNATPLMSQLCCERQNYNRLWRTLLHFTAAKSDPALDREHPAG